MATDELGNLAPMGGYIGMGAISPTMSGGPVSEGVFQALQSAVNQVASTDLTARALLDVTYSSDPLPVGVSVSGVSGAITGASVRAKKHTVKVTPCEVLYSDFTVDGATAQLLEQGSGLADLSDLVTAVQALAAAENTWMLDTLTKAQGANTVTVTALSIDTVMDGVKYLRDPKQAQTGPISAALSGQLDAALISNPNSPTLLRHYCRAGVAVCAMPGKAVAIVLAPGRSNMELVVGQNFALSWLGFDGAKHSFRVTTSLRPDIKNGTAIYVAQM